MTRPAPQDTIVLVDDDAAVRSALTFAFELEGFRVEAHASGEALTAGELPSQGCMVLDYELPGMNGLDLLQVLRDRAVKLPAVLITTQPKRSVRIAAAAAGVPIVEKPLLSDALLESVQLALGGHA